MDMTPRFGRGDCRFDSCRRHPPSLELRRAGLDRIKALSSAVALAKAEGSIPAGGKNRFAQYQKLKIKNQKHINRC